MIANTGQPDDWFAQFNPDQRSPNTGVNGGAIDPAQDAANRVATTAAGTPDPAQDVAGRVGATAASFSGVGAEAFGRAWLASGGRTVADLQAFVKAHPEFGATLFGSKGDKIKFANGDEYDGVLSAGAGGLGATFNKLGGAGAPGQPGGGMLGAMGPWMQPYDKQYTLPTAGELQAMPGYQSGLEAFNRANQNSAAARGTLLNGRTNEAMNQSAQNFGMQQYGALASLGKGAFDTNYQIFRNNQTDPFNKAFQTAQLGKPSA